MNDAELGGIILIFLGINIYFIPTYIAYSRKHHNSGAIFLVNLLLGWSFLGWVVALVWSVTAVNKTIQSNRSTIGSSEKKCPFCAELIKSEAKVCRYCSKELPILENPQRTNEEKTNNSSLAIENYMTIDEFVIQKNINKEKVIKMIREGFYNGQIVEGEWYVHKSEIS